MARICRLWLCRLLALTLGSVAGLSADADASVAVHVSSGHLVGTQQRNVAVFKGVPFAAEPHGARHALPAEPARGENGLSLNIWTPQLPPQPNNPRQQSETQLPVLVWLHDSQFDDGGVDNAGYDGEQLAQKGVVVVTLSFKPDAVARTTMGSSARSGLRRASTAQRQRHTLPVAHNLALLDQLAALMWIKRHIALFGGDPARVTLVGVGSGAASAQALLNAPRARPYFQQLAAFDGHLLRVLEECAQGPTLHPVEGEYSPTLPCIDGVLLTSQIYRHARAGDLASVPVLLGVSRGPGRAANQAPAQASRSAPSAARVGPTADSPRLFEQWLATQFGPMARDAAGFYPVTTPHASFVLALQDGRTTYGMLRWAELQSQASQAVFLVLATASSSNDQQVDRGAWPALLMNNPGALGAPHAAQAAGSEVATGVLADTLSDYLVAFARQGDPSTPGRPHWPAFDPGARSYLEVNGSIRTARDPLPQVLELHQLRVETTWPP